MHIIQIANDEDKKSITRNILEELPEWFGIPEAREEYIRDSAGKVFFCAMENEKDLGFLYLKETGKDTVELAVMGVLKEYHRKGPLLSRFVRRPKPPGISAPRRPKEPKSSGIPAFRRVAESKRPYALPRTAALQSLKSLMRSRVFSPGRA